MGISLRLTAKEEDVLQAFDQTSEQEPTTQMLAAHTNGMKTNGVSQVLTHLQNKKLVAYISGEGGAKKWKKLPPPSSEPSEASVASTSE